MVESGPAWTLYRQLVRSVAAGECVPTSTIAAVLELAGRTEHDLCSDADAILLLQSDLALVRSGDGCAADLAAAHERLAAASALGTDPELITRCRDVADRRTALAMQLADLQTEIAALGAELAELAAVRFPFHQPQQRQRKTCRRCAT